MASDITAAVLSALIPGLGQFYKGHALRGLFVLLFCWTGIVYLLGIVDAYLLDSAPGGIAVVKQEVATAQSVVVNNYITAPAPEQVKTEESV